MLNQAQERLASRIFHTLLYAGRIQAQWAASPTGPSPVDIGEIRLSNLLALLESLPRTQAEFAREMNTAPAYISQMVNRNKGRRMGNNFARRIEVQYGLERGYMDRDHTQRHGEMDAGTFKRLSENGATLGRKWDQLTEPSKSQVRALIERIDALEHGLDKKPRNS
jgi:hypothetical protein